MNLRRLSTGGVLVATLLAVGASQALAADLSDYLERADAAAYSGQRIVITIWQGVQRAAVFDVEHAAGMTVVGIGDRSRVLGEGRAHPVGSHEGAIAFETVSGDFIADDYRVVPAGTDQRLGRDAEVFEVFEAGRLRARMILDATTSAPLVTQVLAADGSMFRYSAMVAFTAGSSVSPPSSTDDGGEYEIMMPADPAVLPPALARYHRADVYDGPNDSEQGFYTDGLFRFSVFALRGRADVREMADGMPYVLNGAEYLLVVAPAEMWILWTSPDRTFVLVGNLPPDHLEDVLIELPRPGTRGFFARIWRGLFG